MNKVRVVGAGVRGPHRARFATSVDVPHADDPVATDADHRLASGTERDAQSHVPLAAEQPAILAVGSVPKSNLSGYVRVVVAAARDEPLAVGRKREGHDPAIVAPEDGDLLARGVEQPGRVVPAPGREP